MDKKGLLQLSGPDRVNIALLPVEDPHDGLILLVNDTQHFSNSIDGELGTLPALRNRLPLETACDKRGRVPLTLPTLLTVSTPH